MGVSAISVNDLWFLVSRQSEDVATLIGVECRVLNMMPFSEYFSPLFYSVLAKAFLRFDKSD